MMISRKDKLKNFYSHDVIHYVCVENNRKILINRYILFFDLIILLLLLLLDKTFNEIIFSNAFVTMK